MFPRFLMLKTNFSAFKLIAGMVIVLIIIYPRIFISSLSASVRNAVFYCLTLTPSTHAEAARIPRNGIVRLTFSRIIRPCLAIKECSQMTKQNKVHTRFIFRDETKNANKKDTIFFFTGYVRRRKFMEIRAEIMFRLLRDVFLR